MPASTTNTVDNGDGTSTTTVTEYYGNGSKSKTTATRRRNDDDHIVDVTTEEFRRGKGQGRDGKRKSSKKEERDASDDSKNDKVTETTYKKDGDTKKTESTTELDDNGEPTKCTLTRFKNGRKSTEKTIEVDMSATPPKKVITTIKYCPDGTTKKIQKTEVFYKREKRWQQEHRETKIRRWDCETNEEIASTFPGTLKDYALLACIAAAVVFIILAYSYSDSRYHIGSYICIVLTGVLYHAFQQRQKARLIEQIEIEQSFTNDLIDTDEPEVSENKTDQQELG